MRAAYEQWHQVLAAKFFGEAQALRSTVLYVDDEVEQELAQQHSIDTSLVQAVADELNWSDPDRPLFWRVQNQCRIWENRGCPGAPPSLPVLALSVLAATRMVSSGGMRKSNYYGRWIQLFGEKPTGYRANKLEHAFTDVAAMWERLNSWLEDTGGLYGTSTISTDDYYWRIGYPISQALVRGADRQILTRFFATTRLRPHNLDEVPGRELLRRLRVWTAGRDRRLSPRLMEEIGNAARGGDSLITSLLERLAGDWDGTLHEPEREHRRRALGLQLMLADQGRRLEWIVEAADGAPETSVSFPGGRSFTLRSAYGGIYAGLESLHPSEQQLSQGIRLEGEELVVEWAPQEVVLLRRHPHLGEWVSTEYFEPGEQHWILAAESAVDEVRAMVSVLGGRTVREVAAPVPGWKVFKGVRAVNGQAFARAIDGGGAHAHVLEPQVRQHAKLSGGLRIAPEYRAGAGVAGHYLRGGAPDLLLPAGDSPDGFVEVVLDGYTEKLRRDPRVPFPLRVLPLDEGEHRVGTAASSLVFTVHDGLHEGLPPGTGTLGYVCAKAAALEPGEVDSMPGPVIRGAEVLTDTVLPRTVLIHREMQEAFLLDPFGGVRTVRKPSVPKWMVSRLPAKVCEPGFEAEVPEGFVWLVYRTVARWSVRALVPVTEIPAPRPAGGDYKWAYAVVSAANQCRIPVWHDYVTAAQEVTGMRGIA